jgi:tetratricopeptide (TPR) repeat protein
MTVVLNAPLLNPYTPGGIGPGQARRTAQVEAIFSHIVHSRSNGCVLFGQRRIGKTTLLLQLRDSLPEMGPIRTVFFDLQNKLDDSLTKIVRAFAAVILEKLNIPPDSIKLPATEQAFRGDFLREVEGAIDSARLVILVDEFDAITPKHATQIGDLPNDVGDPLTEPGDQSVNLERARRARNFLTFLESVMAEHPRLYMVFAMGRYIEDSDHPSKGTQSSDEDYTSRFFRNIIRFPVPLLSEEETFSVVDQAMADGSLVWTEQTRREIWAYTNGHPLFVQALCSHIWETIALNRNQPSKIVTVEQVHAAVEPVLAKWSHAVDWLWKSLNPACKVITSALAQHPSATITEQEMFDILRESGVRTIVEELRDAPALLVKWDLIHPAGKSYHFCVEFIRRWVRLNHPLEQTQKLLDAVSPAAESLYQAAWELKKKGNLPSALGRVVDALEENPSHARALALAASIHVEQGSFLEAERLLGRLMELQPSLGRAKLLEALREQAEREADPLKKIAIYDRILEIHPTLQVVRTQRNEILRQRGEVAMQSGALSEALLWFERGDFPTLVADVQAQLRSTAATELLNGALQLRQSRKFTAALEKAEAGLQRYPELTEKFNELAAELREKLECATLLRHAQKLGEQGNKAEAVRYTLEVARRDIGYPDVTRVLDELVRPSPPVTPVAPERPRARLLRLGLPIAALILGVGITLVISCLMRASTAPDISQPLAAATAELKGNDQHLQACLGARAKAGAGGLVCPPVAEVEGGIPPVCLPAECPPQLRCAPSAVCPPIKECPPKEECPRRPELPGGTQPPPSVEPLTCAVMRTRALDRISEKCRRKLENHSFKTTPSLKFTCTYRTDGLGAVFDVCKGQGDGESPLMDCVKDLAWTKKDHWYRASACPGPFELEVTSQQLQ